jgi:hypothetical protein
MESPLRHEPPEMAGTCNTQAKVTEFPAGFGHNQGFPSVTPAR